MSIDLTDSLKARVIELEAIITYLQNQLDRNKGIEEYYLAKHKALEEAYLKLSSELDSIKAEGS